MFNIDIMDYGLLRHISQKSDLKFASSVMVVVSFLISFPRLSRILRINRYRMLMSCEECSDEMLFGGWGSARYITRTAG